jgi:hypothetical protein
VNRHPGRCPFELRPPVVLIRIRPSRPPQQSAHRQCVFFSLISFDVGAFLTLPRAKPDDTAVERRSISASRNALAINVILKAAMASPPQIARASCTSSSIALAAVGEGFVRAGSDTGIPYAFGGQLGDSGGASVSHPRAPNAERSMPEGAYHPAEP